MMWKRWLLISIMVLCSSQVYAASNDVLLNLRNPTSTSPLDPTLRVTGPADGGTNPMVKLPTLPCRANAVAPTWAEGSIVPCSVDLAGALRTSGGGGGGGNGAILDFVNNLIGATVRDYLNSNPLAVALTDANGDTYTAGGGTQYNQGTVATATDTMTMAGCVRADTAAVDVGVADGDRVRCITDSTGRIWTRVGTIDGGTITSITNPIAVTQSGVWTTGRTWTLASGTDSVSATVSNAFLLDATFTGRWAAAYLDADTIANQTTTVVHGQSYMYNGATWDRIRGSIADGVLVNLGANNDVIVTGTVAVSTAFLLDATFTARINTLGQKTMAASTPVVIASDQSTLPISAVSLPLPTGAATEVTLATRLADATFTGRFPVAYLDADTIANQTTTAMHGQLYGYNGTTWDRLRSTIAGGLLVDVSDAFVLDATVTNRLPAGSTPADNESNAVTISRLGTFNYVFDGATWDRWTGAVTQAGAWNIGTVTTITNPVTVTGGTVGAANIDGSCPSGAASFTVAASNASRTWLALWASPANTDDVYIKLGATATSADGRLAPGQPINFVSGRIYTGVIDAFPNSGTQAVCVMELN